MEKKEDMMNGSVSKDEEMEGARRATESPISYGSNEVTPEIIRRRHTQSYKLKIVKRVKELRTNGGGSIGAFLRSEGLYYSAVQKREKALETEKQGKDELGRNNEELKQKVKVLEKQLLIVNKKLEKAEAIIDIQKKISILLINDQE